MLTTAGIVVLVYVFMVIVTMCAFFNWFNENGEGDIDSMLNLGFFGGIFWPIVLIFLMVRLCMKPFLKRSK